MQIGKFKSAAVIAGGVPGGRAQISGLFDIKDRVIVVTGGCGLLGSTFAQALIEQGARVAVVDLPAALMKTPDWLERAGRDDRALCLRADVTKRDELDAALGLLKEKWGSPFGLINNAAIDTRPDASAEINGPFENLSEAAFDEVMAVNVKGVMLCCQVFGTEMAQAGAGSIVNISSIYGMVAPDQRIYQYRRDAGEDFYKPAAYSVSKSASYNLTRYLAAYWGGRHVRINTLTLGGVFNAQDERFVEAYTTKVPLGRMAHADDYVGPVIFLMSDEARYMTGANLVVDGGYTAL